MLGGGERIGQVAELWRYPVKSMGGERCEALQLDARGVLGDRLHALRTAGGKLGSGKSTERFQAIGGLIAFGARQEGSQLWIEFPDGRQLEAGDPDLNPALSKALAQPLELVREAQVSHLDEGPVHLLTSSSLGWLRASLGEGASDVRRFRPNLLLETPGGVGRVEEHWLGRSLALGPVVRLRVLKLALRCGMTGLGQSNLHRAPRVLAHLARNTGAQFGAYAEVTVAGSVEAGAELRLLAEGA